MITLFADPVHELTVPVWVRGGVAPLETEPPIVPEFAGVVASPGVVAA